MFSLELKKISVQWTVSTLNIGQAHVPGLKFILWTP